jgi:superfamily I DNA/RNA helicase
VIVDEAQELTDAEWQMLLRRAPSRSITIVGDRAQARHGFTESWLQRLERVGLGGGTPGGRPVGGQPLGGRPVAGEARERVALASLSINYRTPVEVMAAAEPLIRAVLPDANVPTSVRESGLAVVEGPASELDRIVDAWAEEHAEGVACVIGAPPFEPRGRIRASNPRNVKGLEFDLVVLVNPDRFGDGIEGAVDRYVAMTRATQQLVLLTD